MSIPGFSAEVTLYISSRCYVKSSLGTTTMAGLRGLLTPARRQLQLLPGDGGDGGSGGGDGSDFPVIDNQDFCGTVLAECSRSCQSLPKGTARNNCVERCDGIYNRCQSTP